MKSDQLMYTIEGNPDGKTLVFLHGWPDDPSLWRQQLSAVEKQYRCVLITLPNFGDTIHQPRGCSLTEWVARLAKTVEQVQPNEPVWLVGHDWGAHLAYLFEQEYPDRVALMITLDVGGNLRPGPLEAIMIIGYQWTLIACWIIGGLLPAAGNLVTQQFARLLNVPQRQANRVQSRCNYPYFYLWRAIFFPWFGGYKTFLWRYKPRCPILYLYGGKKPLMFHSNHWLEMVRNTGGKVVCIPDGDHWFMETHAQQVNPIVTEWLEQHRAV